MDYSRYHLRRGSSSLQRSRARPDTNPRRDSNARSNYIARSNRYDQRDERGNRYVSSNGNVSCNRYHHVGGNRYSKADSNNPDPLGYLRTGRDRELRLRRRSIPESMEPHRLT